MLVLSRKPGEEIRIGTDVIVQVLRITPNNVRLGITAPDHVGIVRTELVNLPLSDQHPVVPDASVAALA